MAIFVESNFIIITLLLYLNKFMCISARSHSYECVYERECVSMCVCVWARELSSLFLLCIVGGYWMDIRLVWLYDIMNISDDFFIGAQANQRRRRRRIKYEMCTLFMASHGMVWSYGVFVCVCSGIHTSCAPHA